LIQNAANNPEFTFSRLYHDTILVTFPALLVTPLENGVQKKLIIRKKLPGSRIKSAMTSKLHYDTAAFAARALRFKII